MRYWIGRIFLWMLGWQTTGRPPETSKCVIVAAPHTSNWDAVIMLAVASVFRIRVNWMIKHTWFRWPLRALLRALGAVSVDRTSKHHVVDQVVSTFNHTEQLLLLITPEGTRGRAEFWKSGFYHIALGAGVPLALGVVDYGHKRGGFGPLFMPTGDIEQDMTVLRSHFAKQQAMYPECVGPVRLKEEIQSPREASIQ